MTKTFDTNKVGEVTLRGAIIDTDRTNLPDCIEILIDENVVGEVYGFCFSDVEDFTIEQVEDFVMEYADEPQYL